jgi:hypothetical protein
MLKPFCVEYKCASLQGYPLIHVRVHIHLLQLKVIAVNIYVNSCNKHAFMYYFICCTKCSYSY